MTAQLLSKLEGRVPPQAIPRLLSISEAPFALANGVKLMSIDENEVRLSMPTEGKMNSLGIGHGAATFLLADHTFAYSSNMGLDVQVALGCNISYFHPVRGDVLTSVSHCLHDGRSTSLHQVDIYDGEVLVASMQGTGYKIRS